MLMLATNVNAYEVSYFEHISIKKVKPFAETCIKFKNPDFSGKYIFSTGQHRKESNKFALLVGMKTVNVFGDNHTQYIRCMFKMSDGSHHESRYDANASDSRIKMYIEEMELKNLKFGTGELI